MQTTIPALAGRCASAAGLALLIAGTSPVHAQTCAPVQECGDVDSSGAVDTTDALGVLRTAVGQPQALTCECADGGPVCGNGIVEGDEDCEVATLDGRNCSGLGFAGGSLACGPGCTFNTSGCYAERFVSRGYGVVIDNVTGLTWEAKRSFGGGAADPHDVDNVYTWSSTPGGTSPDGTVFTDFLAKLNDNCTVSGPESSLAGSFAATCDWRLPTVAELQTILLASCPEDSSPCLDATFGLTNVSKPYWSSMTIGEVPTSVLVVSFGDGAQSESAKSEARPVRAVRGVRKTIKGFGFFPCPEEGCAADRICVDPPGYCARRCETGEIGIQGSCGSSSLCSDVDPGDGITAACVLH